MTKIISQNIVLSKNQNSIQHKKNHAGATAIPAFKAYPDTQLYSNTDEETVKNTGLIFIFGLALRNALKHLSDKMFTSYFSKNPNINPEQLKQIGLNMLVDKGLMSNQRLIKTPTADIYTDKLKKLNLIIEKTGQNAHFDYINKEIKVSKNTLLSLPHEIGHAVQEHSTTILKKLQRFRGNYTFLALLLYGLGRNKSNAPDGKESFIGKIQNTLHKYNLFIPLLAFSPELITEFVASKIGIDYLKQTKAPKTLINAAKKHYAIAFCTYLALPLFAILDNLIYQKATKN